MTPKQSSEALRRDALCQQCKAIMDGGGTLADAARILAKPAPTLHRWMKLWREGGFEAVIPRQAGNSGAGSVRDSWVEQLGEEAVQEVEKRVAGVALDMAPTVAGSRNRLSDGLAWRMVARDPETPAPIREYFTEGKRRSKHSLADSIRQVTRSGPLLSANLLPFHVERIGEERAVAWRTLRTFTSYLPKSKSVEGVFHRLQKFEGTLWGGLGRSQQRRPFERTKRIYEACRSGRADPRLHFLSGSELVNKLNACIDAHEAETLEGEVFQGKPPETWTTGLREYGELLTEPPQGRWLMCADWALVTVSRGMARVRRGDEVTGKTVSYFYEHPDFCGRLDGRQVLIYFNGDAFEEPANILLPGAGGAQAEYIGEGRYVEKRGMFLDGDMSGFELRKSQAGIVTTLYSDLAAYIPSRQIPAEIAQRREAGIAVETRIPGGDSMSFERPDSAGPRSGGPRRAEEPWEEEAALARVRILEAEAIARGDLTDCEPPPAAVESQAKAPDAPPTEVRSVESLRKAVRTRTRAALDEKHRLFRF